MIFSNAGGSNSLHEIISFSWYSLFLIRMGSVETKLNTIKAINKSACFIDVCGNKNYK